MNFIAIIPTAVFAVVVERHHTKFWTAFWNMFALIATGASMILTPAMEYVPFVEVSANNIPLYYLLFGYAVIAIFLASNMNLIF